MTLELDRLIGSSQSVQIVRAARITDPYGSDIPDWDEATVSMTRGYVQPLSRGDNETMVERDEQRIDVRIWLMRNTEITGRDRVVIDGETFEVIGPPQRWRSPGRPERFVQADLRRVFGPEES